MPHLETGEECRFFITSSLGYLVSLIRSFFFPTFFFNRFLFYCSGMLRVRPRVHRPSVKDSIKDPRRNRNGRELEKREEEGVGVVARLGPKFLRRSLRRRWWMNAVVLCPPPYVVAYFFSSFLDLWGHKAPTMAPYTQPSPPKRSYGALIRGF